ncbi:cell wall elongation regulator TseB-like domain-containing protein [Enterococcus sp.]|uniref:cell wall elongation regulator TseB-like domain-containing protein n=1 Tax=Enterococcus sp. TaxID=35783 RepID=UPI002FC6015A
MSQSDSKEKKAVLGLFITIVGLLLIILITSLGYIRASRPMRQARAEAIELANQHVKLASVDQFYWFTREATYFSLVGEDAKGQEIVVIIPKSGEEILIKKQEEGITEEEAKGIVRTEYPNERIKKVTLGMYQEQIVWEVMTKVSEEEHYYLLAFSDGALIKSIPSIE